MAKMKMGWTRQPGEPSLWFGRFQKYLLLGHARSYLRVYNDERASQIRPKGQAKSIPESWSIKSKEWDWRGRAERYDEHLREKEKEEYEKKRRELNQRKWDISNGLLGKADQMLKMPLMDQELRDGQLILKASKWGFVDAARLAEAGLKMGEDSLDEVKAVKESSEEESSNNPSAEIKWLREYTVEDTGDGKDETV